MSEAYLSHKQLDIVFSELTLYKYTHCDSVNRNEWYLKSQQPDSLQWQFDQDETVIW